MGYKTEFPGIEKALEMVKEFNWALLYRISSVRLCKAEAIEAKDWEECIEARIFREDAELHIFPQENRAVLVSDTDEKAQDLVIQDQDYKLGGRFARHGSSRFTVRRYLEADDDGQLNVMLTRLMSVK